MWEGSNTAKEKLGSKLVPRTGCLLAPLPLGFSVDQTMQTEPDKQMQNMIVVGVFDRLFKNVHQHTLIIHNNCFHCDISVKV